jgi:hypothetical protein
MPLAELPVQSRFGERGLGTEVFDAPRMFLFHNRSLRGIGKGNDAH